MADNAVELVLRLRDEATAALKATAAATAEVEKRSAALEAQVRELGNELAATRRQGDVAARGMSDLGDSAGKVGSNAGKLRGILSLASPQLGGLAGLANDAADAVEVLAGGIGLSGTAIASVLAPLALLAGGVAAYTHEMERLEEAERAAAEAIRDTGEALAIFAGRSVSALESLRVQVGMMAPEAAKHAAAVRQITAEWKAQDEAIEEAIKTRKAAGGAWGNEVRALRDQQAALGSARDEQLLLAEAEREWAQATRESNEFIDERDKRLKSVAASTREVTEALSGQATGLLALVAVWDREREASGGVSAAQAGLAYLEKRVAEQERLNALAEEELATAEALAATRTPSAMLGAAAGYISAPLQSGAALDPSGTASAILALAEALGSLDETMASIYSVTVDEETGTREQGGLVGDILGNVSGKGAATLGAWVAQVIGDALPALARGIPDFVAGLVESLPAILEAIARAIPGLALALVEQFVLLAPRVGVALAEVLLDPETWIGIGEAFIDAIGEAIDRLVQGIVDIVTGAAAATGDGSQPTIFEGDWWEQAGQDVESFFAGEGRSKASGATYIDRGGLYMLHAGETVQTAAATTAASGGGLAVARGRMRGSGGRVVVEIDADSLADALGAMSRRGYAVGG